MVRGLAAELNASGERRNGTAPGNEHTAGKANRNTEKINVDRSQGSQFLV